MSPPPDMRQARVFHADSPPQFTTTAIDLGFSDMIDDLGLDLVVVAEVDDVAGLHLDAQADARLATRLDADKPEGGSGIRVLAGGRRVIQQSERPGEHRAHEMPSPIVVDAEEM